MGYLSSTELDVLIAGAGPTGLAAAAEAARFGLRYRIIDRAAHGAQHSQALVVHSGTLEQLQRYELAQRAIESGRRLERIRIYNDGERILEASFDDIPGNYPFVLFLPQCDTERLLAEHVHAQGGKVERGITLESFEQDEDGVNCVLVRGGARENVRAAYVLGADGEGSTVRKMLGIPFEGTGGEFEFFLGDLRVDGDVPGDEIDVYVHGGGALLVGRLSDTHCRIIAMPAQQPQTAPEVRDFQHAIDSMGVQNLRVSDPQWIAAFNVHERAACALGRGRAFLAGDAAGVQSPIGGQGMNTGIQDAANLLWKIALVQSGRARRDLLDSYHAERKTGTAPHRAGTPSNWLLGRIRDGLHQYIHGVNYRESAIVADFGGVSAMMAGDRAPDCEIVDETATRMRLFDLLNEPTHTLLAVTPPANTDLQRFAAILAQRRELLQGAVLTGGDECFRKRYASEDGMLFVVRPDGYIGFRAPASDFDALERWLEERFMQVSG